MVPIYAELAEKLKENKNIIVAEVDSTTNEIPGVSINSYPTIYFFPSNNKDKPIEYDGQRDITNMANFLKKHTTFPWIPIEDIDKPDLKKGKIQEK